MAWEITLPQDILDLLEQHMQQSQQPLTHCKVALPAINTLLSLVGTRHSQLVDLPTLLMPYPTSEMK